MAVDGQSLTPADLDGEGEQEYDYEEENDDDDNDEDCKTKVKENLQAYWKAYCGGCCCCCLLFLVFVFMLAGYLSVAIQPFGTSINDDAWHSADVMPPDFPRYAGCGACPAGVKTNEEIDACGMPCFSSKLVSDWEEFNKNHPYKQVEFPSRKGPDGQMQVNVSALWLPGDRSRLPTTVKPARIVLLHGLPSNYNHCGVQMTAFHLRSMGFDCLTPTLRNWGFSGTSLNKVTWGYEYQYDLLGAWDYAVSDPDGIMGGAVSPDRVGIIGFSLGGFVAQVAFGAEEEVPAAYIFAGPFGGLEEMIDIYVKPFLGPFSPLIVKPVWWSANFWAGVPLDYMLPKRQISHCTPAKRKRNVGIAAGLNDNTVPIINAGQLIMTTASKPQCYDVSQVYTPMEDCGGYTHHMSPWQYPDWTRERQCEFWSSVFVRNATFCGLDELPMYGAPPRPKVGPLWDELKCTAQ